MAASKLATDTSSSSSSHNSNSNKAAVAAMAAARRRNGALAKAAKGAKVLYSRNVFFKHGRNGTILL